MNLPIPERETRFHPTRKWRFDLSWADRKVAVEIDGGVFVGGRHSRGAGYRNDCEKLNAAAAAGWRVFRFLPEQVAKGAAVELLKDVLRESKESCQKTD
jgi:very-short-patch-repair endonuclease